MKNELKNLLHDALKTNPIVIGRKRARRTLTVANIAEDLQIGFVVQKARHRGVSSELVDMGIRIPSVENIYDEYEVFRMRQMNFPNPEPVGWLTFWRPTYSSLQLAESGLQTDAIRKEFVQLYDLVNTDDSGAGIEMLKLLSEARRPTWATAPSSSFILVKALLARKQLSPNADVCSDIAQLVENVPDVKGYEGDVETFCRWLRSGSNGVSLS